MPRFPLLLVLALATVLPSTLARAQQRGQFIEGLFRAIAEAQVEREQRKRIEVERDAELARAEAARQGNARPIELPASLSPFGPGPRPQANPDSRRSTSINVRSPEAAQFVESLVAFNRAMDPLVVELRSGAARNPALRSLLPEAYQVAADCRTLISQCDGLASIQPMIQPYTALDSRWRNLSFKLRSLDGVSDTCTTSIRSCDRLCSTLTKQLRIQPQFDRHALHDLMVEAATYMQALLDDLQLAAIERGHCAALAHDCRLLRQQLLSEADRVDQASYEDVVTRFTDFVSAWSRFSQQVYAINNPHVHSRLDRIRECGDATYGLLWMPPPTAAVDVVATADHLHHGFEDLLDKLTLRSVVSLRPQDQVRVMQTSRQLHDQAQKLVVAANHRVARAQLQEMFVEVDRGWASVRETIFGLPAIDRGVATSIDRDCEFLRASLGVSGIPAPMVNVAQLIQVAALIEGSSEYLEADIDRYARYLDPPSYRDSVTNASHELHHHAKRLHAELSSNAELSLLQREAGHMVDAWQQLSRDLANCQSHGLSSSRATRLRQSQQELVAPVAQIAAALLGQ